MADAVAGEVPALEVDGVSYWYGTKCALNGVSLRVDPSCFAVLLGLNGAGKSTLFSLITRLYASRVGHIRIFGHDVGREPGAALRNLGIVFQSKALDADISVRQNLLYHAALHGIGRRRAEAEIERVLAQVALSDKRADRVGSLSIGQMRRIEIARALLHRPRLLLLDEATAGLDIRSRADILAHVRKLVASERVGVLWATHLIDEIEADDRVVVLHKGRVLAQGAVASVTAAAQASDIRSAFGRLTEAADAGVEVQP